MENLRNYGDERILEFDRQAKEWDALVPDPRHPNNHRRHAEAYRQKAVTFRQAHENDPYWKDREDYPVIEVGKTYEARNGGVFTIAEKLRYNHPAVRDGYLYASTVGTFYTEGGRGTKSYEPHCSDLVREIELEKVPL